MKLFIILIFFCIYTFPVFSQISIDEKPVFFEADSGFIYKISDTESYNFAKPGALEHFSNFPGDMNSYLKRTFTIENANNLAGMTLITALLVLADQDIVDEAQRFGKKIGIKGDNKIKSVAKVFGFPIQMPTDFSSSLYFIGDGWTHTSITSSFLGFGLITGDSRALRTASQLAQGLLTVTFTTQLLKHITGRESPYRATQPGGKWRWFPNQVKYHKKVSSYDAYPSGHLASAMMMVTVISENYKEYTFIKPLGYTLMTILSFQMLNNGVHWASDYPLALAMGYSLGMIATSSGRSRINASKYSSADIKIGLIGNQRVGVSYSWNF